MKKIFIILFILLVCLIFFGSFFWLYEAKYIIGRASVSSASFSIDNSYVFVTPLQAKANNQEKIRITVFVLNNQGLGVRGKRVIIADNPSLTVEAIQGLTDDSGKAVYDVSSIKAGEYYLEVKVENQALKQAHLSFN